MLVTPLLALLLLAPDLPLEKVSGDRALETVKVLAADAFRGRKSGLESGRVAEEWMAEQVRAIGLETSFHELKANVTEDLPGARLALDGKPREFRRDYVPLMYSGSGDIEMAEVVFVGYGIHAPDRGRDDYAGLDVEGRIVLAVRGKPRGWMGEEEGQIGYKSSTAADRGAIGFMLVEGATARPGTIQEKYYREHLPAIWLSGPTGAQLLGRSLDKEIADGCKPRALDPKQRVGLTIRSRLVRDATMRNVVGVWKAKDDARHPEEYVICGAHLDHVGVDSMGNVYNGADDNASGSAMLLEVARAIAAKGERFERNLMFVWFAGEEQGLLGSGAFVKTPPVPIEKMAAMFNADMVGEGKPTLVVGGAGRFPNEAAWLNGLKLDGINVRAVRAGGNSDHGPFMKRGIPSFPIFTQGPHPHYHQPADDFDKIKPELLELTGRFLRRMAEQAAGAERPWCRPTREAEALWHSTTTVDLTSGLPHIPQHGIDLRVVWIEGDADDAFVAIDRELTRAEAKNAGETIYTPRGPATIDNLTRSLKPTVLLGVKGPLATTHGRPAVRLGATILAPDQPDRALCDFATRHGAIVSFECGANAGDLIARSTCAALLTPEQAARFAKERKGPWLAVYRLNALTENKSTSHAEVAQSILDFRRSLGANRLLVVPGDFRDQTYSAQAPTLHPGVAWQLKLSNLTPEEIRQILGGNLLRMIRGIRPDGANSDRR